MDQKGTVFLALLIHVGAAQCAPDKAAGDRFSPAQWPRECHALGRTEKLLASGGEPAERQFFEEQLTVLKYDVVCVADDLVISEPIYTNGGDIVILANSVSIQSSIDTRIWRRDEFLQKFLPPLLDKRFAAGAAPLTGPNAGKYAGGWVNTGIALKSGQRGYTPKVYAAYQDYFKCDECRTIGTASASTRLPDGLTPPTWAWELVPYHVQAHGASQQPGEPPRDRLVDFDKYRPGSIRIYAGAVDFDRAGTLVASGAEGGRGGAGSADVCIGHELTRVGGVAANCNVWYGPGAQAPSLNAGPGRGGDGGAVIVTLVEQRAKERFEAALKANPDLVSVRGGEPGRSTKLESPTYVYTVDKKGDVTDFRPLGLWPKAEAGESGVLRVQVASESTSLRRFFEDVNWLESYLQHDYEELVARSRNDVTRDVLSFEDYLVKAMSEIYVNSLLTLVDSAQSKLLDRAFKKTAVPPALLCRQGQAEVATSDRIKNQILRLYALCSDSEQLLTRYLKQTGGLALLVSKDVRQDLSALQIELAVLGGAEIWNKIAANIKQSEARLIDIYVSVETARLAAELDRARKQMLEVRQQLEAAKARNGGNKTFATLMKVAGKMTAVGDLYDAVDGLKNGATLAQMEKIGDRLPGAISASKDFSAFFRDNDAALGEINKVQGEEEKLRKAIADLQQQMANLSAEMARQRGRAVDEANVDLRRAIEARAYHSDKARVRLSKVHDLFRLAVLDYLVSGADARDRLELNLVNLRLFLRQHGQVAATFSFPGTLPACAEQSRWFFWDACASVPANQAVDFYLDDKRLSDVLFRTFSPAANERTMETHGLPVKRGSKQLDARVD